MRPPLRFRASAIVTLLPARASSRAAIKPAAPAPTIKKLVRCGGAIMAPSVTVVQCTDPSERFIAARGLGCGPINGIPKPAHFLIQGPRRGDLQWIEIISG